MTEYKTKKLKIEHDKIKTDKFEFSGCTVLENTLIGSNYSDCVFVVDNINRCVKVRLLNASYNGDITDTYELMFLFKSVIDIHQDDIIFENRMSSDLIYND